MIVSRTLRAALLLTAASLNGIPALAGITPYLQCPTTTSIHVGWQSSSLLQPVVKFGTAGPTKRVTGTSDQLAPGVVWNDVKITGLQPGTVYTYRAYQSTDSSALCTFATAPTATDLSSHVRFGIVGDTRSDPPMFKQVIDSLKAVAVRDWVGNISREVSLVFHVGDIVVTGSQLPVYKSEYLDPISGLSSDVPFMVSIGNHEAEAGYFYRHMRYAEFGGPMGDKYYAFPYGRVQFIALNTNGPYNDDLQAAWLDSVALDANEDPNIDWIMTFCHHPGHSEVWPDGNTAFVQNRVIPILTKYEKATLLSYGHTHAYERGAAVEGPLHLVLTGGAGSPLDRWRMYGNQEDYPEIQRSHDDYCYNLVDVNPADGSYTLRTFSLGNDGLAGPGIFRPNVVIDQFTVRKGVARPAQPVAAPVADSVSLPVILHASSYSGTASLLSSQVQIRTAAGSFSTGSGIVDDAKRDIENVYYDTGSPLYNPIDKNEGIDLTSYQIPLSLGLPPGTYFWRIRYRDANLSWSDWSTESSFKLEDLSTFGGTINRAASFDGVGSFAEVDGVAKPLALPGREMTVEAWIRPRSLAAETGFVTAFGDSAGGRKGWILGAFGSQPYFSLSSDSAAGGSANMTMLADTLVMLGAGWVHLAGVYDGDSVKLFVNGRLASVSAAPAGRIAYASGTLIRFGLLRTGGIDRFYNGDADEIRLWDAALSADDIKNWMCRSLTPAHPRYASLISWWNFNEGASPVVTDYAGRNPGAGHGIVAGSFPPSSAPFGNDGLILTSSKAVTVGPLGAAVVVSSVTGVSPGAPLGAYVSGTPAATVSGGEVFPGQVNTRSSYSWGMWTHGVMTGSAGFSYKNVTWNGAEGSLKLLFKAPVDSAWSDATSRAYQDISNHQYILSGELPGGAYALGWHATTGVTTRAGGEMPQSTRLYPAYPNPANPSTSIRFDLADAARVRLVVVDILGRRVRTLVDQTLPAGSHEVRWNLDDDGFRPIAAGLYIGTLEVGGKALSTKISVVK
jgi:hypothetical protein